MARLILSDAPYGALFYFIQKYLLLHCGLDYGTILFGGALMIPKVIHYCWFGGNDKPKSVKKCIASWQQFCPDYKIVEWNENNFDINKNGYTKMCAEQKKYAFLSDYARLVIIEQNGGIYFDTDVELVKPIDFLLENEAFFSFENPEYVNTGQGFGSVAHGEAVAAMVREYDPYLDGEHGTMTCPRLNTDTLLRYGLVLDGKMQTVANALILPSDYMNPYGSNTGILNKTENTISIHWYSGSWMTKKQRLRSSITKPIHRIFGISFLKKK